jgi:hypothetical protein
MAWLPQCSSSSSSSSGCTFSQLLCHHCYHLRVMVFVEVVHNGGDGGRGKGGVANK